MKLGPYELNSIVTGDARVLSEAIPDESVDLIFTDPVYQRIDDYRWLAEMAARVLKDRSSCLAFCGNAHVVAAGAAMLTFLKPCPPLAQYVVGPMARLFAYSLQCNLIPLLWFCKGKPKNRWMSIQQANPIKSQRGHNWGKNDLMIGYRLQKFTSANAIVFDPFTGGGTVPAVCKMLGRNYLAFEIVPQTAADARRHVANIQPPLPGLVMSQAELVNL